MIDDISAAVSGCTAHYIPATRQLKILHYARPAALGRALYREVENESSLLRRVANSA